MYQLQLISVNLCQTYFDFQKIKGGLQGIEQIPCKNIFPKIPSTLFPSIKLA